LKVTYVTVGGLFIRTGVPFQRGLGGAPDFEIFNSTASRLTSDKFTLRNIFMISSFKHRGLKRLYEHGDRSGIRPDLLETVERILTVLDAATTPQALDIPRYRLHLLKGDRKGPWSLTVRANRRIIFRFDGTDAFDVELIDCH
jgi:toxin HigB-1